MNLVEHKKGELYVPEDFGKSHHYYADAEGKKEYTGITSVLGVLAKPQLIPWAARMASEYIASVWEAGKLYSKEEIDVFVEAAKGKHRKDKEAAGVHGTDAHALVEQYIGICLTINEGRAADLDESAIETFSGIKPFIDWAHENIDHFLFAERRMSNKELFLAGTADFACVMKDGKKLMGDLKTSSGVFGIDYFLQVAAYRMLAEAEGDKPYDGMIIVRMGKKGPSDFETQAVYEYELFRDTFLSCLNIYRAQAATKGLIVKGV